MVYKLSSSYKAYKGILKNIIETNKLVDYNDVKANTNSFILLRHDVEFSVERAFNLSLVEDLFDVKSSYFFQLSNNAYNILSKKNTNMIKNMYKRGHKIGLHFHLNGLTQKSDIVKRIKKEVNVIETLLNIPIDRFSIHRPTKEALKMNINIPGLINTYNNLYFTFTDSPDKIETNEIKYIADSKHIWNYALPNKITFNNFNKIQLLVHPYSWTEEGFNNIENFKSLFLEKRNLYYEIFEEETNHFKEVKDEL